MSDGSDLGCIALPGLGAFPLAPRFVAPPSFLHLLTPSTTVGGFLLLVYGTLIFNGLLEFPAWTKLHEIETNLLISEEVDDSDDDDESIRALVNRRAGGGRESAPLLQSSSA